MKEILARCANLAHLDAEDAYKLEQDVCDMISLANRLYEIEELCEETSMLLPVELLRADVATNTQTNSKLFENATNICNGCLCVPRVTGV